MPVKKKAEPDSIGKVIKKIRLEKKISYEDIANQTGLAVQRLKKVENGDITPSVGTLLQLSKALQVNFFKKEEKPKQTKSATRAVGTRTDNYDYTQFPSFAENTCLKAFKVQIDPKEEHIEGVEYEHQGEEFVYVLSGTVEVNVGAHINRISKGDSLHFNSGIKHGLKNVGKTKAELIVIIYGA
ncbi:MAG: helix-turn-helix transcriptional regulator [Deltaproteobacteria bacterium]|nr:helix-turn-helix transcriptional regulator [Deltaproteobacteria bacterium]